MSLEEYSGNSITTSIHIKYKAPFSDMQKPIRPAAKTILFSMELPNKLLKVFKGFSILASTFADFISGTWYRPLSVMIGIEIYTKIPIADTLADKEVSNNSTIAGIAMTQNIPSNAISSRSVNNLVLSS